MKEGVRQVGSRVVQTKLRLLGISAIMEKYMQVLFPRSPLVTRVLTSPRMASCKDSACTKLQAALAAVCNLGQTIQSRYSTQQAVWD